MSNRIVCIDEEEYDKKVLNDLKQFVKRFENVAMDVISIEEEYGTEHMYIRKPDNNFLALFVLFLELGINGDRGVYFTRHKDDFDYFKTKLGDLKFKHVDKRQYTATPEFFQEIIEGDVAFKWLVEHFGSIKSALKPFFQVIPYQVGDGNDKVFTYYTYLRRPFSKTSRLPRRNKPSYPTVYQIKNLQAPQIHTIRGKTIYVVPFYTNVSDDHGHSYQFDKIPIMRLNQSTRKCFPEKLEICLCGDSNDSAREKGGWSSILATTSLDETGESNVGKMRAFAQVAYSEKKALPRLQFDGLLRSTRKRPQTPSKPVAKHSLL